MKTMSILIAVMVGGCGDSGGGQDLGGPGPDLNVAGADMSMAGSCAPACTGANMICDPADNKCKLDGTTTAIGAPCDTSGADVKCGTAANATCNNSTQDGFPGGYCAYEPCSAVALCPLGSSCAHLGGETDACFKNCSSDADCRSPDYACAQIDPLFTSGGSHKVCYLKMFACNNAADCPAIKPACTGASGGNPGTCG